MQAKYNGVMNCKNTLAKAKNTLECVFFVLAIVFLQFLHSKQSEMT